MKFYELPEREIHKLRGLAMRLRGGVDRNEVNSIADELEEIVDGASPTLPAGWRHTEDEP